MKKLDDLFLVLAVILVIGALLPRACGGAAAPAQALSQDRETPPDAPPSDEERRALLHLADSVSRVCAHESSFVSLADCLLVWQATRRHGDTTAARQAWLQRHSPCALRGVRCGHGRHQHDPGHWSSTLPISGDAQPEGWPATLEWSDFSSRWAAIRRTVRRLMRGTVPPGGWPCREDPDTWGGRVRDADHVRENAEHLRALDCRDPITGEPTRNEGYRWT